MSQDARAAGAADEGRRTDLEAVLGDEYLVGTVIAAGVEEVAACLSLFERVVAVTGNPVAMMSEVGCYEMPSLAGAALTRSPTRIMVRLRPESIATIILVDESEHEGGGPSLCLFDPRGCLVHRARLLGAADRLLVEGMSRISASGESGASAGRLLSLGKPAPARRSPRGWADADQLEHLDALLADRGVLRRGEVSEDPAAPVRSVDVRVLPAMLDHLCSVGLPVGVGVVHHGIVQGCSGRVHGIDILDGVLTASIGGATVGLDLAAVRECLLVRSHAAYGPTSALELYDGDRQCVMVLTQFGIVGDGVHHAWEHLAESLPMPA